jgi:hypothetical protein
MDLGKYRKIDIGSFVTDGNDLFVVRVNKMWVNDHYKFLGKEIVRSRLTEEVRNETVYWVGKGITIKKARAIALAFLGQIPKGHYLKFKDGDATNAVIDNLEYAKRGRPKIETRKPGDFITYDKSKKKFRLCHKLLPRKQFASMTEAQAFLDDALKDAEAEVEDTVSVAESGPICVIESDSEEETQSVPAGSLPVPT